MKLRLDIAGAVTASTVALAAGCALSPRPCTAEGLEAATRPVFDQYADSHASDIKRLHEELAEVAKDSRGGGTVIHGAFMAGEFRATAISRIDAMTAQCTNAPN